VRYVNWLLACLLLPFVGAAIFAQNPDWNALGKRWWSHIQFLADDKLEGRDTSSPGFEKAANYMADQFRAAGLQPAGVDGYRQPMDFDVVHIDETRCSLDLLRDGNVQMVNLGEDALLGVNSHAAESVEAGAVFVGYGLTIPELNYDDLEGLDVKGKIAVFVTGGPADLPGPIKAHYESGEERRKALAKAGVIGTISIGNPKPRKFPGRGLPDHVFSQGWNCATPVPTLHPRCKSVSRSTRSTPRCFSRAAATPLKKSSPR
jgi:hypothetical protein